MNVRIRRALLSVSDKAGLLALAEALVRHGVELVASGGTGKALAEAGLAFTDVASVTGNPEAFGGRMKTISFAIGSALLFDRDRDAEEARALGIAPIDLVVCNLYPFEAVRDAGADLATLVENVDVGGPTMIRAAAKNFRHVAVVVSPRDYGELVRELESHDGATTLALRTRLMREAFHHTADYDAAIATTMDAVHGDASVRLAFEAGRTLRYGENPHQAATFYRARRAEGGLGALRVLGGKELSFNNLLDLTAALEAVRDLEGAGAAIVKHANPAGLAAGNQLDGALAAAWAGDPVSAFGGVVALNREIDLATASFLRLDAEDKATRRFVEIVAAPSFTEEALAYLRLHKDLRIVAIDPAASRVPRDLRLLPGALLAQSPDEGLWDRLELATGDPGALPDEGLVRFGHVAARQVKSNAIVLVRRLRDGTAQLLGMGAGQPNRVSSTALALERARENLAAEGLDARATLSALGRAVLVSDAFFPFPDAVELAADAGVRVMYQPGGSIRDKAVLARAEALGVTMVLTGRRHFRH